jgi:RNA polymerase sigma-70 factor (ECF subfamily)
MVLVITRDHDTADHGSPNQHVSDHDLLVRMLGGDEPAFTALYRRRQGAVYRFALQMTGSVVIAEDVTQEVFMELIEHGRRFDPSRGAVRSFLYGIARNLVLRRIDKDRSAGPKSGGECRLESGPEPAMEDFPGVEDVLGDLTRRETIDQVRRAVSSLPPVYREAVVLCDLQDLSYGEAAQILDCPVGTVRSRLNRGRAMLAQKLRLLDSSVTNPSGIQKMGSTGLDQKGPDQEVREVPRSTAHARAGESVA